MESKVSSEFAEHNANFFVDRVDYDSVSVLLIYWRDGDLDVKGELTALRKVFEVDLKFRVAAFPLLGDGRQQANLNKEVASFVEEFALEKRSLAIIYYTGHCREIGGKAQWTAKRQGGPTLIWSDIQSACFHAIGDVLLILDCCHATLFTKGQKVDGRLEVLAACAKGLSTPLPGEGSFTWALLKVLSGVELSQGITARQLRGRVEDHTRETPFWDSIGSDALTSMLIKRLDPPSDPRFKRKPTGYVFLRASLSDDLDGIQISDWLKTNAPSKVTAVSIEAVVLKARRLQKNLDQNAFPRGSILRKLSESAQWEILKQLQYLDTRMATAARDARNPLAEGDGEAIRETLRAIEAGADAARTSIETPLLLDIHQEDVNEAIHDNSAIYSDAFESLSLHECVIAKSESSSISFEISRKEIRFPNSEERFVKGTMGDRSVIIDFFEYDPDPDGRPYPEMTEQLQKMSEQICHDKDLGFHILPGIGYVHEDVKNRFGVVFQLNQKQKAARIPPMTLQMLIASHRRMSLSRRIEMAHAIITAVENLHRVEWIHKAIRSDNICFLGLPKDPNEHVEDDLDIDTSSPWLFGFEYARAMAAGTQLEEDHSLMRNLYRHPQRWSRPQVPFTRYHDVYSLGVVLMEIASWRKIDELVKPGGRIKPDAFRAELEKKLKRDFAHQVGDAFMETILACFEFEEKAVGMTTYQMQKIFQTSILGRIQRAVGRV